MSVPSSVASTPALTTGSIAGKTRGLTSNARTAASQISSKASNGRTNAAAPATRPGLLIGAILYASARAFAEDGPRGRVLTLPVREDLTMTDAQHLDELLSALRREMNALAVGDRDTRQRLD